MVLPSVMVTSFSPGVQGISAQAGRGARKVPLVISYVHVETEKLVDQWKQAVLVIYGLEVRVERPFVLEDQGTSYVREDLVGTFGDRADQGGISYVREDPEGISYAHEDQEKSYGHEGQVETFYAHEDLVETSGDHGARVVTFCDPELQVATFYVLGVQETFCAPKVQVATFYVP